MCAKAYKDVGSASPYARKARDDFDRLVDDLERDRFGVSLLVLWDPSRGSRKLYEWVKLIELCKERDVRIFVYTHHRTYDPHNGRDRRALQEDGIDSEYASSKISDGVTRANAANAAVGKWHGRIPYGYKRLRDPSTGKTTAQVPEPREAKIVKELFTRSKKGHSLRAIAADFAGRGVVNGSGKPFSAQHLRSLAVNPTYVGQRVHDPDRRVRKTSDQAKVVYGQWKPLVDKRTFLAVQRILTAPERVTTRPGKAVHLLSMIGKCDVWGGPIAATNRDGEPQYQCHVKGCIRIDKADLDAYAENVMLDYLGRDDHAEALTATEADDAELVAVREELAERRSDLDEAHALAAKGARRGGISATALARMEPQILADIEKLERRDRVLSTPSVLSGLIEPGKDIRRRWKAAEMSTKREVARLLLAPDRLGELRVLRSPTRGHRVPAEQRVAWRQG